MRSQVLYRTDLELKDVQVILARPTVPPTVAYPFHDDDGACMHVGFGAFTTFAFAACSQAALFAGQKLQLHLLLAVEQLCLLEKKLQSRAGCRQC